MPLSDKNLRALEQVAESIRELDRQQAALGEQGKTCEWGEGCTRPVAHQCSRCFKFLCQVDTVTRLDKNATPPIVHYCPECDVQARAKKRGE